MFGFRFKDFKIKFSFRSDLFHTALDMLATLIHSTLVTDSQSERDENKKLHTNLMKKLRKELADKNSATIKLVRQLIQLAKPACSNSCEVIACEPVGSLLDTKVNFLSFILNSIALIIFSSAGSSHNREGTC